MAKIRKEIRKFHDLRRRNNEIAAGMRPATMMPDKAREIIRSYRDPAMDQQAVQQLKDYLTIVHGRTPSQQEMRNGGSEAIEERLAMGIWPAVVAVGIATAGLSVHEIFSHLRAQEERIFMETAPPLDRFLYGAQKNLKWIAVASVAGAGGYIYYKHSKEQEERRAEMRLLHGVEPEKEQGLLDKIKGVFKKNAEEEFEFEEEEEPEEPEEFEFEEEEEPQPETPKLPAPKPVVTVTKVKDMVKDLDEDERNRLIDNLLADEGVEEEAEAVQITGASAPKKNPGKKPKKKAATKKKAKAKKKGKK